MTRSGVEKQLQDACGDMQNDAYWWSQRFPGWKLEKSVVYDQGNCTSLTKPRKTAGK